MSFFDTRLWGWIRNNESAYNLIHRTIGMRIRRYYIKDRISGIRKNGVKSIFEIDRVLSDNGFVHFVDFGTLLGFVRSGSPMKWDYDIDFGLCVDDDFQWSELGSILSGIGYKLKRQFSYQGTITEQTYAKDNVYVDFFSHRKNGNTSYYYIYFKDENYEYQSDRIMHARMTTTIAISGNVALEVKGGSVYVPKEYEQYLEDVYGNDWRVPQPNWIGPPRENVKMLDGFGEMTEFYN